MYASEKVQVSSSLPRPGTQFRHAQGHHGAGGLTGSIHIIQITFITVYQIESQSQLTENFDKGIIGFHKLSEKYFIIFFGRVGLEDAKKEREFALQC